MPKPVRAASRFLLTAVTAVALVIGGMAAPAFAADTPLATPTSEPTTPTTPTSEGLEPSVAPLPELPESEESVPATPSTEADVPLVEADATADAPEAPADDESAKLEPHAGDPEPLSSPAEEPDAVEPPADTRQVASRLMVAPASVAEPVLEVFLADGTTPVAGQTVYFGDTLVVKGANYDPLANVATGRPPIPAGVPGGTYVVFGHFGADWQPSTGASSTLRKVGSQKWAISQDSFDQVPTMYQSAISAQRAVLNADGSFETTLTVTEPSALVTGGSFGVYTYAAGGSTNAVQERAVTLAPTVRPATATTTTLTAGAATVTAGGTVTLSATVAPATAAGTITFTDGGTEVGTAPVIAGTASVSVAPALGAHSYQAQFVPSDANAYATSTSTAVSVQATSPAVAAAGSLSWAIKSSFNSYIVSMAAGSVAVSGGASASGGGYWFAQSSSSAWSPSTQTGTVPFAGSVHFTGHGGTLDVTLSNPTIVVHSASSATLYMNGSSFAALNLAAAAKSVGSGGDVTWSGVPATLTASGASAFAGFYSAGEALDALTFTAGSAGSATGGGRIVVASAPAQAPQRTPAATPPATTGVKVVSGSPTTGGTVTIEAGGYQPNETGIIIVVYSEPVVLGTVTADAAGVARWTGKLPSGLTGTHTLTMQGSISHGAVVSLRPAATARTAVGVCEIADATLTWGFKESFRAYLSSAIAHGEWTVADGATYETPNFSWSGTGAIDPTALTGELAFDGSIRFTGHGGVLDTTVAAPRVILSEDGAVLLLDVTGTTQDGSPVDSHGVEFATLDLAAVTAVEGEGTLTWTAIPAVLTEAGSAAFGTYPAGEILDPLTITVTLPTDCAVGVAPTTGPEMSTTAVDGQSAESDLTWLWWLIGGIVLLAIIIALSVILVRRRGTE